MVVFISRSPKKVLGAFRLSNLYFLGHRPLMEMHYQTVSTRFYSMGIMEIVKHRSAELDTINNMRLDVGFTTNLLFFFYRASAAFDPDEVELRPLKGVPVDNIGDVQFAAMSNVTSFYAQEEQMLYTLVERVVDVTDLFLGISPTRGAAARHATGFVALNRKHWRERVRSSTKTRIVSAFTAGLSTTSKCNRDRRNGSSARRGRVARRRWI